MDSFRLQLLFFFKSSGELNYRLLLNFIRLQLVQDYLGIVMLY
jgi:hypothetical protein